jgi:hypothetical protein
MAYNYSNPSQPFPDQRPPQGRPPPQQQPRLGPRQGPYPPQQGRPRQNTQTSDDGYYGASFWEEYGADGAIAQDSPPRNNQGQPMRAGNFSRPQAGPPPPGSFGASDPYDQGKPDVWPGSNSGPSRGPFNGPPNGFNPNAPSGRGLNGPPGPGNQNVRPGPNSYSPNGQRSPPRQRQSKLYRNALRYDSTKNGM